MSTVKLRYVCDHCNAENEFVPTQADQVKYERRVIKVYHVICSQCQQLNRVEDDTPASTVPFSPPTPSKDSQ